MTIDRIFVDMDGVLSDFVSAALALHGRLDALPTWPPGVWDLSRVLGRSSAEVWGGIARRGEDFWATLPPYPWADELIRLVRQFAPFTILSSPSNQPSCLSGKMIWLQKHFGPGFRDFLIGPPKHLCASPGAVLIDDSDENIARFRQHGGRAVLYPQPWDANHALTNDRLAYVREQL
ncbi:MAG TPA: hypothetical protein EYP14_01900, partial [Planctomycetaceae bacterium]|nr:hypothetical protein [Planctomycetaceae bacterium]